MKRNSNNRVDAILTADWHLREDTPSCRTDDFWEVQWKKVMFIKELQERHNCPVIHSGDLFNHWKPSPLLLSYTMKYLPKRFYTVYGNHDLPQHNMELNYKTGIKTLEEAGFLTVLPGTHWEQEPEKSINLPPTNRSILVWHVTTYLAKKPFPGIELPSAKILHEYDYDLIVTGDNHQTFKDRGVNNNILVNPGSITRQTSDQASHMPCVFTYDSKYNEATPVYLPYEKGVVQKPEQAERTEQRKERIEAFVEKLDNEWDSGVSFEKNMENFLNKNPQDNEVKQLIYESMEE